MSSYDVSPEFGTLYDSAPVYAERADVAFYVEEANRVGEGSVVLELGSGTGRLTLPMAEPARSWLYALRSGEIPQAEMLRRAEELEGALRDAVETSPLPEEPDHSKVEAWMVQQYREAWAARAR